MSLQILYLENIQEFLKYTENFQNAENIRESTNIFFFQVLLTEQTIFLAFLECFELSPVMNYNFS